jgi:hypothetical protein
LGSHTVSPIVLLHVQLAETKVAQSDVSSVVQQDVLRLQVAVDDIETVQALESAQKLGGVETSSVNLELALPLKMVEQLSSVHERQDKVQLLGRLERKLQRHDERVVDLCEYRTFRQRVINLRARDDVLLSQGLEGIDALRIAFPESCVSICGGKQQCGKPT